MAFRPALPKFDEIFKTYEEDRFMKKILKVIGIIVLAIVILIVLFAIYLFVQFQHNAKIQKADQAAMEKSSPMRA